MQKPQLGGGGGIALPDITCYYHAAINRSMLQWWNPQNILSWHMEGIGIRFPLCEVFCLFFCLGGNSRSSVISTLELFYTYGLNTERI